MSDVMRVITNIFKDNLAVKKNERVLILIDKRKRSIGKLFLKASKHITTKADLLEMPVGKINGEEPPKDIADKMLEYDVGLFITSKSLTHTKARKKACEKGMRIATLPNITLGILKRAIDIDYKRMNGLNLKLIEILNKGVEVEINSKQGTRIKFGIKGRNAIGKKDGIYDKRGSYGNLPAGETYLAPVEKTAEGIFVVDGSLGGIGKVDMPVKIYVRRGKVTRISGGASANKLRVVLERVGKKAKYVAEFGIGTNDRAKIGGNLLEDEKVKGTCHIALGNNIGFGGKIDVPLHIDGVIKKPSIWVDKKKIMDRGNLLV